MSIDNKRLKLFTSIYANVKYFVLHHRQFLRPAEYQAVFIQESTKRTKMLSRTTQYWQQARSGPRRTLWNPVRCDPALILHRQALYWTLHLGVLILPASRQNRLEYWIVGCWLRLEMHESLNVITRTALTTT